MDRVVKVPELQVVEVPVERVVERLTPGAGFDNWWLVFAKWASDLLLTAAIDYNELQIEKEWAVLLHVFASCLHFKTLPLPPEGADGDRSPRPGVHLHSGRQKRQKTRWQCVF